MTIAPNFKKRPMPTLTLPRRNALSQRIVASDPVTDKIGPRSTPIKIARVT